MLHPVRVISSIPDGLNKAKEELQRGMIVSTELSGSEYLIKKPSGYDDKRIYGFVDLREDEAVYARSAYDTIEKGKRCQVNTLVLNEEWATDQVEGFSTLNVGDKLVASDTGKLIKYESGTHTNPCTMFELVGKSAALSGYEKDTVVVKVVLLNV